MQIILLSNDFVQCCTEFGVESIAYHINIATQDCSHMYKMINISCWFY